MTDKLAKLTELPHLNMRLVQLTDANGFCYVDLDKIEGISGPMFLKRNPESRKIILTSGYVLYCVNTSLNCEKLGIPFDAMGAVEEDEEDDRPRKPRGRKPTYFRRGPAA